MKKDKQLIKIVDKLIQASFDKSGSLVEENVKRATKLLSSLPYLKAKLGLNLYLKKLKIEIRKKTLFIESAVALSQTDLNEIKDILKPNYQIIEVENIVNKDLLGGLRIRIGDTIFDDSVESKIKQLEYNIRHG